MESNTVPVEILDFVLDTVRDLLERQGIETDGALSKDTPLLGEDAVLDSRSLVELLVAIEEFVEERFDAEFDWTSDKAMSRGASPYRTPEILAGFVAEEASL